MKNHNLMQRLLKPLITDTKSLDTYRRNFRYVLIDAIGVGFAGAAGPFLPVFLTRLGATSTQVGLLTSMPGITGLVLSIAVGRFLQTRRNIVPWFSLARMLVLSSYALTGLVPFFVKDQASIIAILIIWALVTLPQTIVAVAFTVVMNAVAGPQRRYDLMSRRWSILGITTSLTVFTAGLILERIKFPHNYQFVFLGLSVGAFFSYYFSSRIKLLDNEPPAMITSTRSLRETLGNYLKLLRGNPAFISFASRRFVYMFGATLAAPLFPLYLVREVQASDAWIGTISMVGSGVVMIGYYFWARQSRLHGSRPVLLWVTLVVGLYPAALAMTRRVEVIVLLAGVAGIFQAGLDLVFFDELMKTVPIEYSATFVSIAQSLQHMSAIVAPLVGTFLADQIGLGGALLVSSAIRLTSFLLFFFHKSPAPLPDQVDGV